MILSTSELRTIDKILSFSVVKDEILKQQLVIDTKTVSYNNYFKKIYFSGLLSTALKNIENNYRNHGTKSCFIKIFYS